MTWFHFLSFSNSVRTVLAEMEFDRVVDESGLLVGYVTDVEGNLSFWNRYIEHSSVLSRLHEDLVLKDNCHFVYGGDSCDRGCGDLQVLRDLISLKDRCPDRVHLLMGNRDINKLRFPTAMLPEVLSLQPECYFALSSANVATDKNYKFNDRVSKMKWILTNTMGSPYAFEYRRQELQNSNLPCSDDDVTNSFCDVVKLEGGLMLRYLELAQVVVTIGDVMFLHGAIHDFNQGFVPYCGRSNLAASSTARTCAELPIDPCVVDGYEVDDPFEWCEKINAFAAAEIQDFKNNITAYLANLSAEIRCRKNRIHQQLGIVDLTQYTDRELAALYAQHSGDGDSTVGIGATLLHDATSGYFHPQPGSALIMYGMGVLANGNSTRSVIYSSYLFQGRPNPCSDEVAQWLRGEGATCTDDNCVENALDDVVKSDKADTKESAQNNDAVCRVVRRLVVGHQPHADAPLVLHVNGVQIISADSSYSINTQWPRSQLDALFQQSNAVTEETVIQALFQSAPVADEEWLTFTDYSRRFLSCSNGQIDDSTRVNSVIPAIADTRCPVCIAELLFACFENHSCDTTCHHSSGYVHGRLSQGSYYASALNNSVDGDVQNVHVGKETNDGWYVKASNVRLPSTTAKPDNDAVSADPMREETSEWYYLLAHSAGYTFRNQLVHRNHIATHFP